MTGFWTGAGRVFQLAVREMVFIVRELERLGSPSARAFKPYQPPKGATTTRVVTECTEP